MLDHLQHIEPGHSYVAEPSLFPMLETAFFPLLIPCSASSSRPGRMLPPVGRHCPVSRAGLASGADAVHRIIKLAQPMTRLASIEILAPDTQSFSDKLFRRE
jgi:hypothetical protein